MLVRRLQRRRRRYRSREMGEEEEEEKKVSLYLFTGERVRELKRARPVER